VPAEFSTPSYSDPPGTRVADLAVGDLNGDRRSDLVVGGHGDVTAPDDTSLLLAEANGRLSTARSLFVGGSDAVAVSDVNGDGRNDIVRAPGGFEYNAYGDLVVLFGDGHGGFLARAETRIRCCVADLAATDLNADGKVDLVVVGSGGGRIFIGDGAGRFMRRPGRVGQDSSTEIALAMTDLNQDHRPDVAVLHGAEEPHGLSLQFGDGRGGLSPPRSLPGDPVTAFAFGRFDRDRWPDLAAIRSDPFEENSRYYLRVFRGVGGGHLQRAGIFPLGRHRAGVIFSWQIVAADLNGDAKRDLAIAAPDRTVRVLRGTGRATFTVPQTVARCCTPYGELALGFFNRDRKPDLAAVAPRGATVPGGYRELVAILINKTRRAAPGGAARRTPK